MVCDSENQKKLLLEVVRATPINGQFSMIKNIVAMIEELERVILNAKIATDEPK